MIRLWDLIVKSADKGKELQAGDGSMPAGHNGPHNDPETPVRNTAHWININKILNSNYSSWKILGNSILNRTKSRNWLNKISIKFFKEKEAKFLE